MILTDVDLLGWRVVVETSSERMFVGESLSGNLVRNVAGVTRIPSRKLIYANVFADAPAGTADGALQHMSKIVLSGGRFLGGVVGRRSRLDDGTYRFRIAIGKRIDETEVFAEITQRLTLSAHNALLNTVAAT